MGRCSYDNAYALQQIEEGHNSILMREPSTNATAKGISKKGRTLPRVITLGGDHTITLPLLRSMNRAYGKPDPSNPAPEHRSRSVLIFENCRPHHGNPLRLPPRHLAPQSLRRLAQQTSLHQPRHLLLPRSKPAFPSHSAALPAPNQTPSNKKN